MSRPLRIEISGGLYHVTSRGDRREEIYSGDSDRVAWLDLLGEVCTRYRWRCHAWCQMTNHYHLLVETADPNLSRGMRQLNGVYTQRVNRVYKRVGHVFQGRFKALFVEHDFYLLEVARYVVLNPVRAKIVGEAGQWQWSSYAAMMGRSPPVPWLATDFILGMFDADRSEARRRYADFVRAGVGLPSIWSQVKQQVYLGTEAFVRDVQVKLGTTVDKLAEVPRLQRRGPAKPLAHYRATHDLATGMALAYASGAYTMKEIADGFGVHYSAVSRAVRSHERIFRLSRQWDSANGVQD